MVQDIEKALSRELREVADGLHVPPMPSLPEGSSGRVRRRAPLLAAAAVVAVVAAATGVLTSLSDGQDPGPAQPSPAPSATPSSETSTEPSSAPSGTAAPTPIPRTAPTIPYVLDRRLIVDGEQVPGEDWWSVKPAGDAWVAVRGMPLTWWWGRGTDVHELPSGEDVSPKISPDGKYVAIIRAENGEGILTVIDTETGRNVDDTPTSFGEVRPEEGAYVTAVTDEGQVVIRRGNAYTTWSADLVASTLSGQMVLDATAAGVVATDDVDDGRQPYLAELADNGRLTRLADLPEHDDLLVSPGATWMAWTPLGTTGGDVTSVPSLKLRALGGDAPTTLTAPEGWEFVVRTYVWEDDDHLVSVVSSPDRPGQRMARCSPEQGRCVLLPTE